MSSTYTTTKTFQKPSQDSEILKLKSFKNSWIYKISGKYYNLTRFRYKHPGGISILKACKQKCLDATVSFSCSHINYKRAFNLLEKYEVRSQEAIDHIKRLEAIDSETCFKNQQVRNHNISSDPNTLLNNKDYIMTHVNMFELPEPGSFYYELRETVWEWCKKQKVHYSTPKTYYTVWFYSFLLLHFVLFYFQNSFRYKYFVAILNGILLAILGGWGHQYAHIPKFRPQTNILSWIGLYAEEFIEEHVLEHHVFTNTIGDNHFTGTDPFLFVDPVHKRPFWIIKNVYINYLVTNIILIFGIYGNYINCLVQSIKKRRITWDFFLFPLRLYLTIQLCDDLYTALLLFLCTTTAVSLHYFNIALLSHNQSENWDILMLNNKDLDWGIWQMQTCTDIGYNYGDIGSMFCLWLNYHAVHHLFPTLDMSYHQEVQKIIDDTAKKFKLKYHHKKINKMYHEMISTFTTCQVVREILNQ